MTESRINNSLLGIVAIFAIFFMVWLALKDTNPVYAPAITSDEDLSGKASEIVLAESQAAAQNVFICKFIIGQTDTYDTTALASSLEMGGSTYYSGYNVFIKNINSDGCLISIGENTDYIAVGQIQKVGPVYVTVKEVLQ